MVKTKNEPSPVEVIDEALGNVDVGDNVDLVYCTNLRDYIFTRLVDASVEVYLSASKSEPRELRIRVERIGVVVTRAIELD